jgi:hypothetical protein
MNSEVAVRPAKKSREKPNAYNRAKQPLITKKHKKKMTDLTMRFSLAPAGETRRNLSIGPTSAAVPRPELRANGPSAFHRAQENWRDIAISPTRSDLLENTAALAQITS